MPTFDPAFTRHAPLPCNIQSATCSIQSATCSIHLPCNAQHATHTLRAAEAVPRIRDPCAPRSAYAWQAQGARLRVPLRGRRAEAGVVHAYPWYVRRYRSAAQLCTALPRSADGPHSLPLGCRVSAVMRSAAGANLGLAKILWVLKPLKPHWVLWVLWDPLQYSAVLWALLDEPWHQRARRLDWIGRRARTCACQGGVCERGRHHAGRPVCAVVTSPESGDRTAHPIDQIARRWPTGAFMPPPPEQCASTAPCQHPSPRPARPPLHAEYSVCSGTDGPALRRACLALP